MREVLGGLEVLGDPGAPHSQCQEVPEVQVGQAGPGYSLPFDPESQDSQVGPEVQAARVYSSRRSHHWPQVRPSRLSVRCSLGLPCPPSFQLPVGGGQRGTALVAQVGPPLLCHPLVLEAPPHLAVLEAQACQTPQMHCCHRWAFQEGLGVLEAQGGQAFPSC